MRIKKEYHFHCAHRNEQLADKCNNLHGHTYHVSLIFNVHRNGSVTTLFADFDKKVLPLIAAFDHATLIHQSDPMCGVLHDFRQKLYVLLFPSSAENMCYEIWRMLEITAPELDLVEIQLKETTSSTVIYDKNDYLSDVDYFNIT
jgi:6-pyruvoyltetrahydropterin/6-carboxytetrahydropterin synthase